MRRSKYPEKNQLPTIWVLIIISSLGISILLRLLPRPGKNSGKKPSSSQKPGIDYSFDILCARLINSVVVPTRVKQRCPLTDVLYRKIDFQGVDRYSRSSAVARLSETGSGYFNTVWPPLSAGEAYYKCVCETRQCVPYADNTWSAMAGYLVSGVEVSVSLLSFQIRKKIHETRDENRVVRCEMTSISYFTRNNVTTLAGMQLRSPRE